MSKGRFIVIVLDSFGVGAMDDVSKVRPQDLGSNTAKHLIESPEVKIWPTLEKLGLMNILNFENDDLKMSPAAIFGRSELKHFGADSYFGHQEIAGTNPFVPIYTYIQIHLDDIEEDLIKHGYEVHRIYRHDLAVLKVDNQIIVGDNMETDLGQAINVVGALDDCGFDKIEAVGRIVRKHVKVARVIAFGGSGVTIKDLEDNIIYKEHFIGVDAPGSGVYKNNYHVDHMGYGVDAKLQVPTAIHEKGVKNYFYGKVENIILNPEGKNYAAVDSEDILDHLIEDVKVIDEGFFFVNIQETDLAGHAEDSARYIDVLNKCDVKISELLEIVAPQDVVIVMADHGNDPTIGHSKHTREEVPLLIYRKDNTKLIDIGKQNTMANVGQTVADYFNTKIEYGTSFLSQINPK